jgi:alpha/beta superfamily hydrolase
MKEIQGPAGRLEARLDRPAGDPKSIVVMASPYPKHGGTMQDKVMYQATQGFVRAGCAVLRFNYRSVGTSDGEFSDGPGEMDDYRAALGAAAREFPGVPIWAAGYSFGAWIAMTAGAADPRVTHLIGIGVVIDSKDAKDDEDGRSDKYDYAAVRASEKPKFLIHGGLDELSPAKSVRKFYGELAEPRELVVIDEADHYFDGHASEVADAIEDLLENEHA